jgi:hypothetical protein
LALLQGLHLGLVNVSGCSRWLWYLFFRLQAICFISFYTGDLIPPEAVMKLRQKHPGTIRVAEEDLVSSIFEQRIFPFFHFLDF